MILSSSFPSLREKTIQFSRMHLHADLLPSCGIFLNGILVSTGSERVAKICISKVNCKTYFGGLPRADIGKTSVITERRSEYQEAVFGNTGEEVKMRQ